MKPQKTLLAACIALLLLFFCAGCGAEQEEKETADSTVPDAMYEIVTDDPFAAS